MLALAYLLSPLEHAKYTAGNGSRCATTRSAVGRRPVLRVDRGSTSRPLGRRGLANLIQNYYLFGHPSCKSATIHFVGVFRSEDGHQQAIA